MRFPLRSSALLGLTLGLSACVAVAPVTRTPGPAVLAALSGSSVVGSLSDGQSYCEYHDPGGLVVGRDFEVYAGTWRIGGDAMCYSYPGFAEDCQLVQITGSQARFVDNFGALLSQGNIVPGNICR